MSYFKWKEAKMLEKYLKEYSQRGKTKSEWLHTYSQKALAARGQTLAGALVEDLCYTTLPESE